MGSRVVMTKPLRVLSLGTGVPLDTVDLRTNEEQGIFSLFDQECAGMCGV